MASRQATPDILSNIMNGTPVREPSHKAIKAEIHKEINKPSNITAKQPNIKTSKQPLIEQGVLEEPSANNLEELKEKATFNLPVSLLQELEDKWSEIRRFTRSKQISKTLLVEKALEIAFSEYEQRKDLSEFYSKLVNDKSVKQ